MTRPAARAAGPQARSPFFFFCDHASNHMPEAFDGLGLSDAERGMHIAYDIGAEALTEVLCDRFDARGVYSTFSRLIVDPNRGLERPDLIPEISGGIVVPGNQNLSADARQARIDQFWKPYHAALADEIAAHDDARPRDAVIVSVHSFTPQLLDEARPWQVAVLWNNDEASARRVIDHLIEARLEVGDNVPYSGRETYNHSIDAHVGPRELAHVTFEVRQDLLTTPAGIDRMADLLSRSLRDLIEGR
ncbi:MAG: N-formylglutamate amidohydrolase [Maricaulaceae bacterium]